MTWQKVSEILKSYKEIGLIVSTVAGGGVISPLFKIIEGRSSNICSEILLTFGFLFICIAGTKIYSAANEVKERQEKIKEGEDIMDTLEDFLKPKLKAIAWFFGLAIISLVFWACQGETKHEKEVPKEPNEIKVGVIAPLTGDVASYGENVKKAADLALEEINKSGGVDGNKLKFIYEDSQCKPENAVSAYKKLISIDNVRIIIGPICSSCTFAVGQIAQSDKVLIFTPISSADNISEIGDYVFRLAPYDSLQGQIVAKWLTEIGYKKVAVLHINNDYGVGLKNSFEQHFKEKGGNVVVIQSFNQGETDLKTQWLSIEKSGAEAVFAPAYPTEAVSVLLKKKELGVKIPLYGTDPYHDPKVVEVAKNAADGVQFTDVADGSGEEWDSFVTKFKNKYNSEPNIVAAETYDAVMLLHHVMLNFGTTSEDVKTGLSQVKGYKGATGLIEFNESGDCVTKSFIKYKIENGVYKKMN